RRMEVGRLELSKACVEGIARFSYKACLVKANLDWERTPPALPATGILKLISTQPPCDPKSAGCDAKKEVSVSEAVVIPERPFRFVGLVMASCLGAALIIVVVTIVRLRTRSNPIGLLASMGSSKWDRNSWGTNVTIAS